MIIRDAVAADLEAVTGLHNALIPTSTVTWSEELETSGQRAGWFESQNQNGFAVVVADDAGEIVGFASYGFFRGEGKWPGYRQTAEHSVHVRQDRWASGIGTTLMEALIDRARTAGIHVLVAAIDGENEASIRFHARLGFIEVARMPQTGQKFGRWLDLVLMQKILDPRSKP